MRVLLHRWLCLGLLLLAGRTALAQHGHLNAGAVGTSQGDALTWANGSGFAESSGYVKSLVYAETGNRAGYYAGSITLTSLPATVANGGPAAGAAALGSFLQYGIVSVTGPAGGSFGFWEAGATTPTFSYASGFASASPTLIALSEAGAGVAGADPFGHLHGRNFTVTQPGEYSVGFQAFDTSTSGTGGAPIHAPSEVLTIKFSAAAVAVPEPGMLALLGVGVPLLLWGAVRRR
jgi:hypothetical protein